MLFSKDISEGILYQPVLKTPSEDNHLRIPLQIKSRRQWKVSENGLIFVILFNL